MAENKNIYKLKFKASKNLWSLEGPFVKLSSIVYHQLLNRGISEARSRSGELMIYNKDGSLKEVVKY